MKKIALGADHAGYEFKNKIIEYLRSEGYECEDLGTNSPESVDYPVFAGKVCKKVLGGEFSFGILICGTGIGMSIAANRYRGIRAALCGDEKSAEYSRQHNDANVLCMGARIIPFETALKITDIFLKTEFAGGRHKHRIDLIDGIE